LKSASGDYEEEVLIFLEMLKIFFPSGLSLEPIEEFRKDTE
jgi:hypothetical protein